jgi:integrase
MATNYTKNGTTYYRSVISYGRGNDGKIRRKEFLGKTKKESDLKRKKFEKLLDSGLSYDEACIKFKRPSYEPQISPTIASKRLLGDSIRSWLFDVKRVADNVKPSSFERYEGLYRLYINDYPIALLPFDEVKSNDLQKHYNSLYENQGKSYGVMKEVNKLIKAFFNYEIEQERILINPCSGKKISLPGGSIQKKRTEIMPQNELKQFITALQGNKFEMLFLLGIGTGMRIGELLALKLSELDLETCTINVVANIFECSVFDADGNKHFQTIRSSTKNRLCRTVPIPANLIPKLKAYLINRKKHKFKIGSAFVEEDYVFPNMLGGPIGYSNIRKQYLEIFKTSGIPFKKIHSLRHLYASLLNENGTSLTDIQELLGHSDVTTTQIYIHTSAESKRKAVDKLSIL